MTANNNTLAIYNFVNRQSTGTLQRNGKTCSRDHEQILSGHCEQRLRERSSRTGTYQKRRAKS